MRTFTTPGDVYNATPPRIVFGPGTTTQVRDEALRLGARRALVVTTPGRVALGQRVADLLGDLCVGVMDDAITQVPIELAQRSRIKATEFGADCLVSVGGGAAVGLGKGIALELALPIIAIPTTYSGSEMTAFCGITIDGVKIMHSSLRMLAATVIYDAELSLTLPPAVSAASAMNALAHCVDAFPLPTLSPLMAVAALESARIIGTTLDTVRTEPGNLAARNELLYSAYLAGGLLSGGFALQHELAHVLGGSFGVEHGQAHAVVLPHVTEYHARFIPDQLSRLAEAMGASRLDHAIFDLVERSGLPVSLPALGLDQADMDRAARLVDASGHESYPNPAPITDAAVRSILQCAYDGRRPA